MAQVAQPSLNRDRALCLALSKYRPFHVYNQDQDPQGPFFHPIRLRRPLGHRVPPVAHHPNAWEHMVRSGAATTIRER